MTTKTHELTGARVKGGEESLQTRRITTSEREQGDTVEHKREYKELRIKSIVQWMVERDGGNTAESRCQ